jgi:hypothetical protein
MMYLFKARPMFHVKQILTLDDVPFKARPMFHVKQILTLDVGPFKG